MRMLLKIIILWVLSAAVLNAAERKSLRESHKINLKALQMAMPGDLEVALGLSNRDALKARRVYIDPNGDVTIRYRQVYRGIPVIGDDVIVTRRGNGSVKRLHGYALFDISKDIVNVTSAVSEKKLMRLAKQLSANETVDSKTIEYENESSRLAIWRDENGKARLVYEVSFMQYANLPSRPYYIFDAKTGEVLKHFDSLRYFNATGPGGNQKTGVYYYGINFGFLNVSQTGSTCAMFNENVKTIDFSNVNSASAFAFTCPENTYKAINGAFSPLNDAHFFGNITLNMYKDWLHIDPLPFQVQLRVHFSTNFENAFWGGNSATFGDGGSNYYPFVSLDIVAHEISHGFTDQNSDLSFFGQSWGLDEAFSDMSGEAAEYYLYGTNDWMLGEKIFKGNGAMRYLYDPPLDGNSIDNQNDYVPMDGHYSAGVYNKAFYNLATAEGWNTRKAFEVYARANMLYWSANTNWDEAGNGVMDAACDLGYDTDAVQASLASVGINSSLVNGDVCGNMVWLVPIINLILF